MRWLAYWAVGNYPILDRDVSSLTEPHVFSISGWQASMTEYKIKIKALFELMEKSATHDTLPANRWQAQMYIDAIRTTVVGKLVYSFQEHPDHEALLQRFKAYNDDEECRLRDGLEVVKYDIDGLDTLGVINGRRGLERVRPLD